MTALLVSSALHLLHTNVLLKHLSPTADPGRLRAAASGGGAGGLLVAAGGRGAGGRGGPPGDRGDLPCCSGVGGGAGGYQRRPGRPRSCRSRHLPQRAAACAVQGRRGAARAVRHVRHVHPLHTQVGTADMCFSSSWVCVLAWVGQRCATCAPHPSHQRTCVGELGRLEASMPCTLDIHGRVWVGTVMGGLKYWDLVVSIVPVVLLYRSAVTLQPTASKESISPCRSGHGIRFCASFAFPLLLPPGTAPCVGRPRTHCVTCPAIPSTPRPQALRRVQEGLLPVLLPRGVDRAAGAAAAKAGAAAEAGAGAGAGAAGAASFAPARAPAQGAGRGGSRAAGGQACQAVPRLLRQPALRLPQSAGPRPPPQRRLC